MDTPREWSMLQRAADYETVHRTVRISGIGSVVWGILNCVLGVMIPEGWVVTLLGLTLVASGIWMWVMPSPAGLMTSSVTMFTIGALNLVGSALAAGSGHAGGWPIMGIFQIVWGVRYLKQHRRFRNSFQVPATESERTQARALLDSLRSANVKQVTDVAVFTAGGFPVQQCRLRLMELGVVALIGSGDDVRVLRRPQFGLQVTGDAFGGARKVEVRMADVTLKGSMPAESVARVQAWENAPKALAA